MQPDTDCICRQFNTKGVSAFAKFGNGIKINIIFSKKRKYRCTDMENMIFYFRLNDFEVPMKHSAFSPFAVDNASILYLSLIRKDHTNTFRFTMTLCETVSPEILQQAVDRVYRRFPSVIAGFIPGFFRYLQVPARTPPQVQPDPGMLITMGKEELKQCAYRVYYQENRIIIEAFHALTDGFGAIASLTTLAAEYIRIRYGVHIPVEKTLVDIQQSPEEQEVSDSYLTYEEGTPLHLPSRYAYQLPGAPQIRTGVHTSSFTVDTRRVLEVSRSYGVSITALLSTIMAQSVMEIQQRHRNSARLLPVRVMVPVDLRRLFPSKTLRNFILYALPTMEPQDARKPLAELFRSFGSQLKDQVERKRLASIMAYNVRTQRSWFFQAIPLFLKCAAMRLIYRFFGESNSSVTVTNLGNVTLPEQMLPYVTDIRVFLTPRVRSPYNCAVIAYNGLLSINVSRFCAQPELENVFYSKLQSLFQVQE